MKKKVCEPGLHINGGRLVLFLILVRIRRKIRNLFWIVHALL